MFGILYGMALGGFSLQTDEEIRFASYRSGLWFFIMSILAAIVAGLQTHCLMHAAESEYLSCTRSRRIFFRSLAVEENETRTRVLTRLPSFFVPFPALSAKIRSQSFRAILRSDVSWFDEEKNSVSCRLLEARWRYNVELIFLSFPSPQKDWSSDLFSFGSSGQSLWARGSYSRNQ